MSREYTSEEIAIIRSNAAAADLERQLAELPVAIVPSMVEPPDRKATHRSIAFAYQANGGDLKLAVWAKDNYGEFITKIWSKTIEKQVEVNDNRSIEDILNIIDQEAVDASYEDVVEDRD